MNKIETYLSWIENYDDQKLAEQAQLIFEIFELDNILEFPMLDELVEINRKIDEECVKRFIEKTKKGI